MVPSTQIEGYNICKSVKQNYIHGLGAHSVKMDSNFTCMIESSAAH